MDRSEEERAISEIVERLGKTFRQVPPAEIVDTVSASIPEFADAPIRDFAPHSHDQEPLTPDRHNTQPSDVFDPAETYPPISCLNAGSSRIGSRRWVLLHGRWDAARPSRSVLWEAGSDS